MDADKSSEGIRDALARGNRLCGEQMCEMLLLMQQRRGNTRRPMMVSSLSLRFRGRPLKIAHPEAPFAAFFIRGHERVRNVNASHQEEEKRSVDLT